MIDITGVKRMGAFGATRAWLAFLLSAPVVASADGVSTRVRFQIVDEHTGDTTPAMVCITGTTDGDVRLPPDGRVCEKPGRTDEFYKGIRYELDRNWIGPVRKTMGRGDNNDRSYVYELRPSLPYWQEPVMYQTSGDFTIDLPEGSWRVAVEHGMEFVPVFEEFTLDGQEREMTKNIRLERWVNLAEMGWWSGDVHVHHPILEKAHRDFLLEYAIAEDVHVVNVLEMGHHQGTDFKQEGFGPKFRVQRGDYWLVPGQEEPRSNFGHIIGLNLRELARVEDIADYEFYDLNFKAIHAQPGALVGFAHFAWNGCSLPRGMPWYVTTGEIDFIELLQMNAINRMGYYDYLNLGFRLTAAAGTDIPWGSTLGEVRTYVYTGEALDIDGWFQGIKDGRTFVSNGPALMFEVDGRLPGSEIVKSSGETVKITARAWGHPATGVPRALTIVDNDGVVKEVINEPMQSRVYYSQSIGDGQTIEWDEVVTHPSTRRELSLEIEVPVERSRWIVASTVCGNNAVAHTTPVYVVVDDQPTWCPERGPVIIESQLKQMADIAAEFDRVGHVGKGVHERLNRARSYYENLRAKMHQSQVRNR